MAKSNETVKSATSNTRPRQVLLVGLGGVGSRTVDKVLSMMPEGYKPYTKAIAVDTDLEELDKQLKYIPVENRIALGSNPENGQSITVGEYIRNHPETTDWFVKGEHLDLIKRRNTAQGAKQVRMVSRIALAATNDFLGMKKKLEDILQDLNRADGTTLSRGLLVMVICSVAGGTGAGTVLQFPLYLEQALAKTFSDEDVAIECSMLLPNVFSRAQDIENQTAARANAYAVIRELMAMNSGRLKRGDLLPDCDFEEKSENISPYGRIMFFDDVSMAGDSIDPDLDRVYVPKTAAAINEYLFGPVSGKITSALDNTLARVYRTGGASIFSSVGTAKLAFPRATYVQYITGQWITKAMSKTWLDPDREVSRRYRDALKNAIQNNLDRPDVGEKRVMYCDYVDEKEEHPFYKQIRKNYVDVDDRGFENDLVSVFVERCEEFLAQKIIDDVDYQNANIVFSNGLKKDYSVENVQNCKRNLGELEKATIKAAGFGTQYAVEVMQPIEADNPEFYTEDNDEKHLFTFLRNRKLHPIMTRYFLYRLYAWADELSKNPVDSKFEYKNVGEAKKDAYKAVAESEKTNINSRAKNRIMYNFATRIKIDLEKYIEEIEGMFQNLEDVVRIFGEKAGTCLNGLVESNPKTGTILAGGRLSMMYTWKRVENLISEGEDAYTIDPKLNNKIHELVYKGFVRQIGGGDDAVLEDGSKIKIRTKYDKIMVRELQVYYSVLIKEHYSMCLPSTVIDAALLECGLRNAYADERSRADDPDKYTEELFINRGGRPQNYATDADEDKPNSAVSNARYLNALLSQVAGNSKPYCGRIDDNATDKGIMNRLMVANQRLLRTTEDTYDVDENGVAKQVYIEDELIEGVATSRVANSTKYVTTGISVDEIKVVTTLAGLQPFNFVSFLPPDDNEHAPTKAKSYYIAYRDLINDISVDNNCITPHLHRDWHLADRLDDLTDDYTNTYNKDASRAFVYGFVFNVIKVKAGGMVEIGKMRDPYFARVFGERGTKAFWLLDESAHANIDTMDSVQRKNTVNTIFVKVFELLATSQELRDAICGYAAAQFAQYAVEKSAMFVKLCKEDEETAEENLYTCILDVINGYYQGTRRSQYKEVDRADKNIDYMFMTVLEELFNVSKLLGSSLAGIKKWYLSAVDSLYKDGYPEEYKKATAAEVAAEAIADDQTTDEEIDEFEKMLAELEAETEEKDNLFASNGKYNVDEAKEMVEVFLKNN